MAILLQKTHFQGGKYNIPDAGAVYYQADVQEMIDRYEQEYICQLFGAVQGKAIIAWIQGGRSPANADYSKVEGSFIEDTKAFCPDIAQSQGLLEFLKAAIFYEYHKNGMVTGQTGAVTPKVETTDDPGAAGAMRYAEAKFNDLLDTVDAIQWYCRNNAAAFPNYNGQMIQVKFSSLL